MGLHLPCSLLHFWGISQCKRVSCWDSGHANTSWSSLRSRHCRHMACTKWGPRCSAWRCPRSSCQLRLQEGSRSCPELTLEVHVVVLLHLRPTCREVTLEYESDGEVEEHVGEISDPDDPKQLPSNQPIKNQSKTVAWQSTNQKQSKTAA